MLILILNLFTTVFIAAGIIKFVDNFLEDSFSQRLKFLDAMYYMIITSGTIGYGDIYPTSVLSRLVLMVIIVKII